MTIEIPEIIRPYIENIDSVPLTGRKHSTWFYITREEQAALVALVASLDAVPTAKFATLPDAEKWRLSCMINDAERILRNCIIKEDSEA